MASSSRWVIFFVLLAAVASSATAHQSVGGGGAGRKVGGRTNVSHVESNKEVQDLGLFCVEEYNQRRHGGAGGLLTFSQVVAAERQVVSGIKYYLTIAARDGRERMFDAVVVVKPWLKSRVLLSFAPSARY